MTQEHRLHARRLVHLPAVSEWSDFDVTYKDGFDESRKTTFCLSVVPSENLLAISHGTPLPTVELAFHAPCAAGAGRGRECGSDGSGRDLCQSDFKQPSDRPKLRENRGNELNNRVAPTFHRMNNRDAHDVSEVGRIPKNNEKRRPLLLV